MGEKFFIMEVIIFFFGILKFFQNKDVSLCQMVYFIIKEFVSFVEDIIMVMSIIMKDIGGSMDVIYCLNVIRVFCCIIDV